MGRGGNSHEEGAVSFTGLAPGSSGRKQATAQKTEFTTSRKNRRNKEEICAFVVLGLLVLGTLMMVMIMVMNEARK